MSKVTTKTINISLPAALLEKIDEVAKNEYATRSDFIRETLVHRLKGRRIVDEWGDPAGEWEKGLDLRDESGEGMPIEQLIAIITDMTKEPRRDRQDSKVSSPSKS